MALHDRPQSLKSVVINFWSWVREHGKRRVDEGIVGGLLGLFVALRCPSLL